MSAIIFEDVVRSSVSKKKRTIQAKKPYKRLSRKRRSELLGVARSSSYYKERKDKKRVDKMDEKRMRIIDETHCMLPATGARKMAEICTMQGIKTTRYKAQKLMEEMRIKPCYPKPITTIVSKSHPKYPYKLKGKLIWLPNQVWAIDITYIALGHTHLYLIALIDWATRYIVGYKLSNTLQARPCVEALQQAIESYGAPAIINSDQGSTFSSSIFTRYLEDMRIVQSMDGKGRWVDDVVIERWFRTLKTEWLRNDCYETPRELQQSIARFVDLYNTQRPHASLGYKTPSDLYYNRFNNAHKEIHTKTGRAA